MELFARVYGIANNGATRAPGFAFGQRITYARTSLCVNHGQPLITPLKS
jgi:hypothetical protein